MTDTPVHVILGGTGGIGSAVARDLNRQGARVALAARDSARLDALSTELGGVPARSLDATSTAEVEAFVRAVADQHGRLDGVVNCVGSMLLKSAHATSDDEWRQTIAANLDSAFAAVRAGGKVMRGGGSIVLMSSTAARVGLANHEAIAAAKAGVMGLGLAAAATYAGKGIRVNVVAPGLVETPMSAGITSNPMMRKASEGMHPLGRIGRPDDVARVITWLLDPANDWITGQVIGVDGGLATVRGKARA
jgi:NAD(P)-dependent dehydrogenase (short-subunit alcohol dehydrogenase family)